MAIYRMEKSNHDGTFIEVTSNNKLLFNRLELAIDHVFKEFEKED